MRLTLSDNYWRNVLGLKSLTTITPSASDDYYVDFRFSDQTEARSFIINILNSFEPRIDASGDRVYSDAGGFLVHLTGENALRLFANFSNITEVPGEQAYGEILRDNEADDTYIQQALVDIRSKRPPSPKQQHDQGVAPQRQQAAPQHATVKIQGGAAKYVNAKMGYGEVSILLLQPGNNIRIEFADTNKALDFSDKFHLSIVSGTQGNLAVDLKPKDAQRVFTGCGIAMCGHNDPHPTYEALVWEATPQSFLAKTFKRLFTSNTPKSDSPKSVSSKSDSPKSDSPTGP
jgi:hypothetical protein